MDFSKYVGLPYKHNGRTEDGVDCWGLARLVYKQELNIDLPSYADLYSGSWDEQVTKLIEYHREGWQQVQTPEVGDLCVFNIYGEPAHVGVYVGNKQFLHCREGLDSVIENLNSPQWKKRLDGYFRYKPNQAVTITGAPHPLRIMKASDWTVAGTTVQAAVDFIYKKYELSRYTKTRLVVMLDGIPVPASEWSSTTIKENQQLTYRTIAEGNQGLRLLLVIAVIAVTQRFELITKLGSLLATGAVGASTVPLAAQIAATAIVGMASGVLINAIAPVRPPKGAGDPGQPNQLNLFNGSSNQISRMGAIPVVLGKVRYTGLHGATPYIETLTDTNILNMIIVWGFGPLEVSDINVGTTNLTEFFFKDLPVDVARPVTLYGSYDETQAEVDKFNELYPTDIEQQFKQVELPNNPTDGNPWVPVVFQQQATGIDIAFTFPEGMRKIQKNNGDIDPAYCTLEIQVGKASEVNAQTGTGFTNTASLRAAGGDTTKIAYSKTIQAPTPFQYWTRESGWYNSSSTLYRWYVLCIGTDGNIVEFAGAVTDSINSEPSLALQQSFLRTEYGYLLGTDSSYTRLPEIPPGYYKLYTVCLSTTGLVSAATINHLSSANTYTGLVLNAVNNLTESITSEGGSVGNEYTGNTTINITGGTYIRTPPTATNPENPGVVEIYKTSTSTVSGAAPNIALSDIWCNFLKTHGVFVAPATGATINRTQTFLYTGFYNFEASVAGSAVIKLIKGDGTETDILNLPGNSFTATASASQYIEAGTYTVRIVTTNYEAVALRITYSFNGGENIPTGPQTLIIFGTPQNFYKRKDPFNWVYRLRGLPRDVYAVRVRRADPEILNTENSNFQVYSKCLLYAASCYDNTVPSTNPPRSRIAKTAIKVQSTSKANGQVDGINALVQTKCFDWDRSANTWKFRATNNPASLFLYVLTHPANAYRVANVNDSSNPVAELTKLSNSVDLAKIIEWHNFCNPVTPTANNPRLTYNAVITDTTSVMDILRDICAAGKASPIYLDGKWSVIIDKPRTQIVQHFTPHNSWGFESTKVLPRLPHAFRLNIQDESEAYQTKELYVYNYGYSQTGTEPNKQAAEIFEELQLPGVTNIPQAMHLARWHLAQLKLRPEVYTINVDFEYLVCNRGDLVKVSHDVPMWGTGTGRIKSVNAATKTLELTESVYLASGTTYRILVRNNSGSTVYKTLVTPQTGYYSTITVVETIGSTEIVADNLFMLGELNKETQDLIVISIEPTNNKSARLTLVDYSPEIYTADLENDLLEYDPNITLPSSGVFDNVILGSPNIVSVTSSRETSQEIANGIFRTAALLTFNNAQNLNKQAERVQFELVPADEQFNQNSPAKLYVINKETGNYTFSGLITGLMYKVRARYMNGSGSVFGPWGNTLIFVAGTAGNDPIIPVVEIDQDGVFLIAKAPQTVEKISDFMTYEFRLYKDSGTEDFWNVEPTELNKIKIIQSLTDARFNLMEQDSPRISESGISYRVACRMVSRTGSYSSQSALGTIFISTIK